MIHGSDHPNDIGKPRSLLGTARRVPIIALAPNSWFGLRMNRQHILSRLAARGWPVIYSTGPLWLWQRRTIAWKKAPWFRTDAVAEGVRVDQPGRLLPRWERWPFWDSLGVGLHARGLKKAIADSGDYILYLFHPHFWPYVDALSPRFLVSHAYDAYTIMPGWSDRLNTWQSSLVERANLRIVTFAGITRFYPEHVRDSVHELPNGVDARHLARVDTPPSDLAAIPHPRIGYTGAINGKLDFALLIEVISRNPQWNWVFIGSPPQLSSLPDDSEASTVERWNVLLTLPNVFSLGRKDFGDIPAYLQHMDVNTLGYRTGNDGWWSYGSPNKVYEALASGRPVVATPLQAISHLRDSITLAITADEWTTAINNALDGKEPSTPESRRLVAERNTWDNRVDTLELWLHEMISHAGE